MRGTIGNRRPTLASVLLLLLAVSVAGACMMGATSEAQAEESWGYDLGHELMSPYCPGRTLATCPSPQAAELVQWIVTQEAAGVSQEQVLEMLVDRFGEDILGAPPAEGFTLWAYILPVAVFVIGGGLAFVVLRRVVKGGPRQPDAHPLASAGTSARVAASPPLDATGIDSDEELARLVDSDLQRRA